MPEKCPKCGAAMFNGKPRKPDHGSCCTCQKCGYFYDDCICHVVDGEVCIERQRDLFAAALAVDLGEWVQEFNYREDGTDTRYEIRDSDGYVELWPIGDFLPLAYAIAEYEQNGENTDEEV